MICPLFQLAALAVLTVASAANTFVGCRVDLDDPFPGFAINTPSTEACAVSPNGPGVKAVSRQLGGDWRRGRESQCPALILDRML